MKLALLLLISSLSAALPPYWQDSKEICQILSDPQLERLVPAQPIESITRESGGWFIQTSQGSVHAIITYLPVQTFGPARFTVRYIAD